MADTPDLFEAIATQRAAVGSAPVAQRRPQRDAISRSSSG